MIASALLLLPDFLLIALGAAMKRVRAFDAPFWRGLERFVYFVLFPALLFRALATATMSLGDASASMANRTVTPSNPLRMSGSAPRIPRTFIVPSTVAVTDRSWI